MSSIPRTASAWMGQNNVQSYKISPSTSPWFKMYYNEQRKSTTKIEQGRRKDKTREREKEERRRIRIHIRSFRERVCAERNPCTVICEYTRYNLKLYTSNAFSCLFVLFNYLQLQLISPSTNYSSSTNTCWLIPLHVQSHTITAHLVKSPSAIATT